MAKIKAKPRALQPGKFFVVKDPTNGIKRYRTKKAALQAADDAAKTADLGTHLIVGRVLNEGKAVKQFEWV